MRKYGKLVFAVVAAVVMLVASPTISYGKDFAPGYDFQSLCQSPFSTTTSDQTSELAKNMLKSQVDAADPTYDRAKAEGEKKVKAEAFERWFTGNNRTLVVGPLYTGPFRSYDMTTTTTTQPAQSIQPSTQPSTQPGNTGSSSGSSSGSAQPTPQPSTQTQPTQSVDYFYADYDMGFAKEKCSLTDGHIFNFTVARSGYTFLGWYDEDGNQVTSLSPDLAGKTLTAHWREDCFYLDLGMGGSVEKNRLDDPSMFLYDPFRPGYVFAGWYDENGNRVTSLSDDLAGKTLTARWEEA